MNEELQDRIFDEYLIAVKRPKIIKYLNEGGDISDVMYESAKDRVSIGVEKERKLVKEGCLKEENHIMQVIDLIKLILHQNKLKKY